MICGRSWGSGVSGWIFCVLQKGHAGPCKDWHGNPPNAACFEDQPDEQAAIEKQRINQAKQDAKKQ